MPTKNGSGRGSGSTATTNPPGNQTPNTPDINESEIARLKVDQLRDRLRRRGVSGTADMRKDDLVKALVKAMKDGAKKSTSARAGGSSRGSSSSAKKSTSSANPPGNQTPNTPDVNESEIARLKVDELRSRLRARGVSGTADMQKADLVKALVKSLRDDSGASSSSPGGGGVRKGPQNSRSIKYAQEVTSVDDEPERPGRSLVTTDHEVIRRWAEARKGVPTTVDGTEHDGHAGVLRFDFPSNGREQRLREISWEEWFRTFDERRLNFIYQEERSDGKQSNFFRLESPDREDG
ncbi:SAP domain-containing protein [Micromonospora chersina]|uniref:SAP domain-containing protein n=1 Tax=Micromonospora chersina TaxID=47854 RepID=UPI0037B372AE